MAGGSRYTFDYDRIPNVQSPYISIRLADQTLHWTGGRPDYFTSLSQKRFVKQANTATISVAYAPSPGDDINRIEKAIVASRGYCYLQYGHVLKGGVLDVTDLFKCLIYDYSVEFHNGSLEYTLSLISQAVIFNTRANINISIKKGDNVIDKIKEIMGSDGTDHSGDKLSSRYIFDEEGSAYDACFKKDFTVTGTTGISALNDMCAQLGCVTGKTLEIHGGMIFQGYSYSYDENIIYVIEIDDAHTDKGYIRLRKVDLSSPDIIYTFDWGSSDSVVIDWSIKFQGTYTIMNSQVDSGEDTPLECDTSAAGDLGQTAVTFKNNPTNLSSVLYTDPIASANAAIYDDNWWNERSIYSYGATLTVIGNPKLLALGSAVIEVNPIVANQKHHSAGLYWVVGIEDKIDSSGYKTIYSLVRISDPNMCLYKTRKIKGGSYVSLGGGLVPASEYDPYQRRYNS